MNRRLLIAAPALVALLLSCGTEPQVEHRQRRSAANQNADASPAATDQQATTSTRPQQAEKRETSGEASTDDRDADESPTSDQSTTSEPQQAEHASPHDTAEDGTAEDGTTENETVDDEATGGSTADDGSTPPDPPAETPDEPAPPALAFHADRVTGTVKGIDQPVNWYHDSHGLKVNYAGEKLQDRNLADVWLADQLTQAFRELGDDYGVEEIRHLGLYNYRVIAGTNTLSNHSFGLAMDISGFILKGGEKVTVLNDWDEGEKGEFLRRMEKVFKKYLHTVLTPDFNAAHADHFHVDLMPSRRPTKYVLSPNWSDLPVAMALWLKPDWLDDASVTDTRWHTGD